MLMSQCGSLDVWTARGTATRLRAAPRASWHPYEIVDRPGTLT